MSTHVRLRDFYRNAKDINIPFNPKVFPPDEWTQCLASGVNSLQEQGYFSDKHVLEGGIGTGVNLAGVATSPNAPRDFTGCDLMADAVTASQAIAEIVKADFSGSIQIFESDLLKNIPQERLDDVDVIFACIPQLPMPQRTNLEVTDPESHFYVPNGDKWDSFFLGLNSNLLHEARIKVPNADVILNLSGRPGLDTLKEFFADNGRECEVLHEQMVRQHQGSRLAALARDEAKTGHVYEFFADAAGDTKISATEAEERRVAHEDVFHKIYVMKGAPALAA